MKPVAPVARPGTNSGALVRHAKDGPLGASPGLDLHSGFRV